MIWVGSFKSLQSVLDKPRFTGAPFEVHTWLRTDIDLISPLVDWLMNLIAESGCVQGEEQYVELAVREAVNNAMIHGNRLNARKLVHICCGSELNKGVCMVVRDQGKGFDPSEVPDPLAFENLAAEHGRGIHLMKLSMDEVSFERNGAEVHLRKAPKHKHDATTRYPCRATPQWLVRPSLGGSCCRITPTSNFC